MATINSATLSNQAQGHGTAKPFAEFRAFWRQFVERGVQPLPAGTALYARPRPGLARKTPRPFELNFPDN
jgi:hypothetical protein